jgi:tetratricopeptide (TPR) repeat protein
MVEQSKHDFEEVKQQAHESFRVLSLLVLAEQQVRAHNVDTAIRTLQTAHEMAPNNQATNYLLGYLYSTRKQFDLAIERLEHALRLEPDFTPAIAALGLALRRKGDSLGAPDQRSERAELWAQAESKLLEALRKDKRLTDAEGESYFGTLGGLYRRQGRYDDALYAYEQAQQVTPDSSYPIINLATLYKHQGQDDQAAHYYRRVLKTAELQLDDDPRNAWSRADYAQAKLVLGEEHEALHNLQALLETKPERGVLETVYDGLRFLGESPSPITGLDKMLDILDSAIRKRGEAEN